jgi:hypothetical protein
MIARDKDEHRRLAEASRAMFNGLPAPAAT